MAKTKISEFSTTPSNNTDIDSINISEGCAPSGINDAIRELMSQLKDFQTGAVGDSFNGPVGTTTAAAGAFTTLSASSTVTLSGGTANGVPYLNGSKVLTSGSALVFDGSNLGLGVTPSAWATFKAVQIGPNAAAAFVASNGADSWFGDSAYYNAGWKYAFSGVAVSALQQSGGAFKFYTAPSGTAGNAITFTQAMTLDASGNLLVMATSDSTGTLATGILSKSAGGTNYIAQHTNASGTAFRFYTSTSTLAGAINTSGNTTAYTSISDYRLKENVQPLQNALEKVAQLNPVSYSFINNAQESQGFIAHELQVVVPECVTGEKDAVDAEGNPIYQGIDTSFLVATLTAAIQELKAIVDAQGAEIAALKAAE
jgi:hypothetical protein